MWCVYTMEYHSGTRTDETLPCPATWVDLETIMLGEISQRGKVKNCMILLIHGIYRKHPINKTNKQKSINTDYSMAVTRGKGGEVVKGKLGGQIFGDRRGFDFGYTHTKQYTGDVL